MDKNIRNLKKLMWFEKLIMQSSKKMNGLIILMNGTCLKSKGSLNF